MMVHKPLNYGKTPSGCLAFFWFWRMEKCLVSTRHFFLFWRVEKCLVGIRHFSHFEGWKNAWQPLGVFQLKRMENWLVTIGHFSNFEWRKTTWRLLGVCSIYKHEKMPSNHHVFFQFTSIKNPSDIKCFFNLEWLKKCLVANKHFFDFSCYQMSSGYEACFFSILNIIIMPYDH